MPDARVYIWYPEGDNIGHASMHIGDHQEPNSTAWYVSWWPAQAAGLIGAFAPAPNDYNGDVAQEGGPPHVVYTLNRLNINTMKAEWDGIRNNPAAHYRLLPENCSTIVAQVLRAGGVGQHLNIFKELSYAHNLYWTPKNVAQLCNQLRDKGVATKVKSGGCPTKGHSKMAVFLGMR